MAAASRRAAMRPCLFCFLFLPLLAAGIKFDYGTLTLTALKLLGDAHLGNGSIHLSRDLLVPNSGAGRALYARPVRLRHPVTAAALPFDTSFSFSVTNLNPSSIGGGLAFLLCSDDASVGDPGGFLGLLNASSASPAMVVAVEFDTLMDEQFEDINANHVGVDLGSMVSTQVADLEGAGVELKSGEIIHAWINYADDAGVLRVFVSYSGDRPAEPVIAFPVDLARFINEFMYVGFSGSTQGSTEVHTVHWWSFSSFSPSSSSPQQPSASPTPLPPAVYAASAESPANISSSRSSIASPSACQSNGLCRQGPAAVVGVATAGVFVAVACAGVGVWVFTRRGGRSMRRWDTIATAAEIVNSPREFSYRELSAATRGFDRARIIGHGAFGNVYKGIVPETGVAIAVKRCIQSRSGGGRGGGGGQAEFLSELSIIAGLRHRNLVRLQGWCQEKGEILLVYDYMPHGSLDKALFEASPSSAPLGWRHRREILVGVASALAYLHRECERQVIHRDIKTSNIMLDASFQARLGDFGLARQVDHDKSPDATVTAGTMGYLAPEYLLTGRATEKTDVFSFGTVVLEVACGRRPIEGGYVAAAGGGGRKCSNLVEWVWALHEEGRVVEAADARIGKGEFSEEEMRRVMMVGLACSSTDPERRPVMRRVVQMLTGEAEVPPASLSKRSSMSLSANHHLLLSLQDSVSDYNALLLNSSSSSSSFTSIAGAGAGAG